MANLVIIDISGAPRKLVGNLQRIMLEIRPGTYVWKLSSQRVKEIWAEITKLDCSAVCIFAAKNESGFVVATHGENKRQVISNYGVALIKYNKVLNCNKAGKSL